jgi:hypothetical protein
MSTTPQRIQFSVLIAVLVSISSILLTVLAGWHYVVRWQTDSPARLEGADVVVTDRTRQALTEALDQPGMTTGQRRTSFISVYQEVLRSAPFSPYLWREMAAHLFSNRQREVGFQALETARVIDPRNPLLRHFIGNDLFVQRGATSALGDYRESLRRDPVAARGAYLTYWQLGADPVGLMRSIIPNDEIVWRNYLRDGLTFLPAAKFDALWKSLSHQLLWPDDAPIYAEVLQMVVGQIKLGEGEKTEQARVRARKYRAEILNNLYNTNTDSPDQQAWLRADLLTTGTTENIENSTGIFNPTFALPLQKAGLGDWILPPMGGIEEITPQASLPAELSGESTELATTWLHLNYKDLPPKAVNLPAQLMLLDGPASYTLHFEAATRGLFTSRPFRIEVLTRGLNILDKPQTWRFRSDGFAGERSVRKFTVDFHVYHADDGPQLLRLYRRPGDTQEPANSGEIWIRFTRLEKAPLDEELIPQSVSSQEFQDAINRPLPDLFDLLDSE